jgi:hypothetical protein
LFFDDRRHHHYHFLRRITMAPPPLPLLNPYAKGRAAASTQGQQKTAKNFPEKSENTLTVTARATSSKPLSVVVAPTTSTTVAAPRLVAAAAPVDKKAQLKQELANLKKINEEKKKQLELEKQRRKEEKRKRKQEAIRKAQCEKDGVEYTALTVNDNNNNESVAAAKINELVTPSPHLKVTKPQSVAETARSDGISATINTETPATYSVPSNTVSNTSSDLHSVPYGHFEYPALSEYPPQPLQQAPLQHSQPMFMQPPSYPNGFQQQQQYPMYWQPPHMQQTLPGFSMNLPATSWNMHPAYMPFAGPSSLPPPSMTPPLPILPQQQNYQSLPYTQPPSDSVQQQPDPIVAHAPLEAPSPFASSHYLLSKSILMIKRPNDTSFGVTLKRIVKHTTNNATHTIATTTTNTTDDSSVFVISVDKVDDQNARHDASKPIDERLQPDDLILSVNGKSTGGLTFVQVIQLIRECAMVKNAKEDDKEPSTVSCALTIARRKAVTRLTPTEIGAFASCMIRAMLGPKRICGSVDVTTEDQLTLDPLLSARNLDQLQYEWNRQQSMIRTAMAETADFDWKMQWAGESIHIQTLPIKYLTDANRSTLRMAPKPVNGCRCGATDHDFVDDIKCPLYSNLRLFSRNKYDDRPAPSMDEEKKRVAAKLSSSKDLNVVEKAFKDRFIRDTVEKKRDELEAAFVLEMEEIQLKKLKQASRAPTLAAMVLSTVIELYTEFQDVKSTDNLFIETIIKEPLPAIPDRTVEEEKGNDDDDDDVPLMALGKRPSSKALESDTSKKARTVPIVRPKFLARLLHVISAKWGHLYSEPDHADYAWRWELFHGENSTSGSSWELYARNPRPPGSLSMENIKFAIDESTTSLLESPLEPFKAMALNVLSIIGSPAFSGVSDELQALCKSKVLRIDEFGIPVPTKDWWANVDIMMLEDMHGNWGSQSDPRGLNCVSNKVRKTLGRRWRRNMLGWALADSPEEIVYRFEQFDDWRHSLEGKLQAQTNAAQGIGRFGI